METSYSSARCDHHGDRDGDRDGEVNRRAMLKKNTRRELSKCAAAALIACCWSGLELAVRRGIAAAAHWRSGAVAGCERRAEMDIAVDEELYYAARAEHLNVRGHGSQKTPRNNRVQQES